MGGTIHKTVVAFRQSCFSGVGQMTTVIRMSPSGIAILKTIFVASRRRKLTVTRVRPRVASHPRHSRCCWVLIFFSHLENDKGHRNEAFGGRDPGNNCCFLDPRIFVAILKCHEHAMRERVVAVGRSYVFRISKVTICRHPSMSPMWVTSLEYCFSSNIGFKLAVTLALKT